MELLEKEIYLSGFVLGQHWPIQRIEQSGRFTLMAADEKSPMLPGVGDHMTPYPSSPVTALVIWAEEGAPMCKLQAVM